MAEVIDRRKIIKGSALLTISGYLSGFLWYLFFFVLARWLGVEDFGRFMFALTFVALFRFIMDVGISQLSQREIARDTKLVNDYFFNVMGLKTVLIIISLCLITLSINVLDYPPIVRKTVYILSIAEALNSFSDFFRSIFRANHKMHYETVVWVAERILVLSIVIVILNFEGGIVSVALVVFFTALLKFLAGLSIVIKKFIKRFTRPSIDFLNALVKRGVLVGLVYMLGFIYFQIDTVMLSLMLGDEAVGLYNASFKLLEGGMVISTAFGGVLYPLLSSLHKRDEKRFKSISETSIKYMLMISLPVASFITLMAGEITSSLFGVAFSAGSYSLQVLIWTYVLQSVSMVAVLILLSMGEEKRLIKILFLTVILNVILNYILIPPMREVGAAFTTVASETLVLILAFYSLSSLKVKIVPPLSTLYVVPIVIILTLFNVVVKFLELLIVFYHWAIDNDTVFIVIYIFKACILR